MASGRPLAVGLSLYSRAKGRLVAGGLARAPGRKLTSGSGCSVYTAKTVGLDFCVCFFGGIAGNKLSYNPPNYEPFETC